MSTPPTPMSTTITVKPTIYPCAMPTGIIQLVPLEALEQAIQERDNAAVRVAVLEERNVDLENQRDKLDAKLTEVVEAAERAGWNGVENSKHLPTFITTLAEDLSKAQAVADVVLAQAVRRMEAVPKSELQFTGIDAIRARLIAAAKGEGQAKEVEANNVRPNAAECGQCADKTNFHLAPGEG